MVEVWFESGFSSFCPAPNLYVKYDEQIGKIEYKFYDDGRGRDYSSKKLTSEEIDLILDFLRDSNNIARFFNTATDSAPIINGPHLVSELLKMRTNGKTKVISSGISCNYSHPFKAISEAHRYSINYNIIK